MENPTLPDFPSPRFRARKRSLERRVISTLRDWIHARMPSPSRCDRLAALWTLFHEAHEAHTIDRTIFQRSMMTHLAQKARPEALSALFTKWSNRAGFLDVDRLLKLLEPGGTPSRRKVPRCKGLGTVLSSYLTGIWVYYSVCTSGEGVGQL